MQGAVGCARRGRLRPCAGRGCSYHGFRSSAGAGCLAHRKVSTRCSLLARPTHGASRLMLNVRRRSSHFTQNACREQWRLAGCFVVSGSSMPWSSPFARRGSAMPPTDSTPGSRLMEPRSSVSCPARGWKPCGSAIEFTETACKSLATHQIPLQHRPDLRIVNGLNARTANHSARERGMTKETTRSKIWTKPEIRRLGEIKDVAGAQGVGAQGAGTKT